MGNRKLPFGYQMRMGEIVRCDPEAKSVQDIFLQYTLGASLKEIAEQMRLSAFCAGVRSGRRRLVCRFSAAASNNFMSTNLG